MKQVTEYKHNCTTTFTDGTTETRESTVKAEVYTSYTSFLNDIGIWDRQGRALFGRKSIGRVKGYTYTVTQEQELHNNPPKPRQPMSQKEYALNNGCLCPKCGKDTIEQQQPRTGQSVRIQIDCECGATWTEVYKLAEYNNLIQTEQTNK